MTSSAPRASGRSDSMIITLSSALETTPVWLNKCCRGLGEPYTGPIWPNAGLTRATEKLNSSVANAMIEFDVIPMQDHQLVEPQPGGDSENQQSGCQKPYFLRNCTGASAVLSYTIVCPYVAGAKCGRA